MRELVFSLDLLNKIPAIIIIIFLLYLTFNFYGNMIKIISTPDQIKKLDDIENQIAKLTDLSILNTHRKEFAVSNDKLLYHIIYQNKAPYDLIVESDLFVYYNGKEIANYTGFGPFTIKSGKDELKEYTFYAGPEGENEIKIVNRFSNTTGYLPQYGIEFTRDFDVSSIQNRLLEQSNNNSATALYVSIIIGGVTAIVAITQYLTSREQTEELKEQNKLTSLIQVFNLLNTDEHRRARESAYTAYKLYKTTNKVEVFLEPTIRQNVATVRADFDEIGAFIKNNLVPKDSFMDIYANTVLLCWKSLEDHIKDERTRRKYPTYMQHFEWLSKESETYWKNKHPEEPIPEPYYLEANSNKP